MASQEVEEGYRKALAELKAVEDKYRGKSLTTQGFKELKKARNKVGLYTKEGAFGRGVGRAITDVITGIPDLAAMGINYGIRKASDSEQPYQLPILGDELRKSIGVPEKELDPRNQFAADVPGYIAAAVGVKQLLQLGWKGLKSLRNSSKMKKLLGELPTNEANALKMYMVKGQGSDSPLVQSAIERMRGNVEYKELFSALEEGASKATQKVATVRPSKQQAEEATIGAAKAVEKAVESVKKARDNAGAVNFQMAEQFGRNRPIVPTGNTMQQLAKMRQRFNTNTPEGNAALRYINELERSFDARIAVEGGGELVLPAVKSKLTVQQIQNKMREFGAQIGGSDAAVNSLSVNTKDLINKAVFAGLKGDLNAVKTVGNTADQKAIGYLIKARDDYSKGTQAYNDLIAKGIPKFLRDKPINEIEFPDLVNAYEGLTGSQRKLFRTWVGENRAESLQAIDKAVFDNFKNKAFKEVRGGKQSYDLGVMAREWERLRKTDPEKAVMLTDALGTNASEFSKRMKDALVFTRKMEVGAQKAGTAAVPGQQQAAALAGAVGGYPAAKVTDLTIEAINASMKKNGISDETLMKLLLTDEGASFLKTASLSPQGRETLEKLTSLNRATIPETVSWLAAGQPAVNEMRGVEPTQETAVAEEEIIIPDELPAEFMQSAPAEEEIIIPDELPAEFSDQPTSDPLGQFIQNLPQQAQASPAMDEIDASVMQRLQQLKKQKDPNLNIDFVFNAFKTAPSDKKQNMIRMMGL
tara:strand:+ start:191 stop:2458 length:2268 start_codon:yes stop_codon:yes gene_type:complete